MRRSVVWSVLRNYAKAYLMSTNTIDFGFEDVPVEEKQAISRARGF